MYQPQCRFTIRSITWWTFMNGYEAYKDHSWFWRLEPIKRGFEQLTWICFSKPNKIVSFHFPKKHPRRCTKQLWACLHGVFVSFHDPDHYRNDFQGISNFDTPTNITSFSIRIVDVIDMAEFLCAWWYPGVHTQFIGSSIFPCQRWQLEDHPSINVVPQYHMPPPPLDCVPSPRTPSYSTEPRDQAKSK